MRFGLAATVAFIAGAIGMAPSSGPMLIGRDVGTKPLPSVARAATYAGGMNAHQLAALSAKNARRRRRS